MKTFVIVLSAGSSTRFLSEEKKQFYSIKNRPVLFYSLNAFEKSKLVDEVVLVTAKEDIEKVQSLVKEFKFKKVAKIVEGGSCRQESVKNGLDAIEENEGYVLIHDSARPIVTEEVISSLVNALKKYDGAAPAIKIIDTVIKVDNNELSSYEDRDKLYRIQTPQAFRLDVIKEAHVKFVGQAFTDDTQLVKLLEKKVGIVEGHNYLTKITTLEDTHAIEAYIEQNEYLQN